MKKDGFVSMTLVYTFLILFLFLMLAVLNAYTQQNKYLKAIDSKINLTINTPISDNYCPYSFGQTFNYEFINDFQTFIAACKGTYKIELWGAEGGSVSSDNSGKGAYTAGNIYLSKNDKLYIYVGEKPNYSSSNCYQTNPNSSFNGTINGGCVGGGGATDVRLVSGTWNDLSSLKSRIMVAAGGGGTYYTNYTAGAGGGLNGYSANGGSNPGMGGSQISNTFGIGGSSTSNGGGGYFAGEAGTSSNAGGGSSFISGHAGCIAIYSESSILPRNDSDNAKCIEGTDDVVCSYHYSNKFFTNTIMIDGKGYSWSNLKGDKINMPKYNGNDTMEGNTGNGYAKITFLSE